MNTAVDILENVIRNFDTDLIKMNEHKLTSDFCDTMFSLGLWPLTDKPSKIAKECATLIDDIFTNNHYQTTSGLLLSDITDHLPMFVII